MNWTNEIPDKIGWYWYKQFRSKPAVIVEVYLNPLDQLYVRDKLHVMYHKGEWYGPLTEPIGLYCLS